MAERGGDRGGFGRGFGDRGDRGRGDRRRGRPRKEEEQKRVPVTKLALLVKEGKILTLEQIYLHSLKQSILYANREREGVVLEKLGESITVERARSNVERLSIAMLDVEARFT